MIAKDVWSLPDPIWEIFWNGVGNRQLQKVEKTQGERSCNCELWHQTFQSIYWKYLLQKICAQLFLWCVLRLVVWTFDVFAPKVFATYHSHLTISDSCCWGKLARTTQVRERCLMFADSGHHCRLRPIYFMKVESVATIIQEWAGGFGATSIYYSRFKWSILSLQLWGTQSRARTRSRPSWITYNIYMSYCYFLRVQTLAAFLHVWRTKS